MNNSANESSTTELFNSDGEPIASAHVEIGLDHFENHTIDTNIEDYDVPFNVSWLDLSDVTIHNKDYSLSAVSTHSLDKRINTQTCVSFALQAGQCVFEYWDIANGVWQLDYNIYKST